eukprot:CAMPEP_0206607882 /NCGR_PEP_ID=MMETSP0325_2-20121206/52541_1 /ASSEMBLY_ACC=CAM_ASM_000347 /TAXON_ID=2866 /ORGANISM="Crypthecodinium cohnii, Strain Seligo" /LENGTH=151 /DNA_ID=CAMNT_0054125233 /DNA_START=236 /DNA_END=688 /DNA_ORIENTATION=+
MAFHGGTLYPKWSFEIPELFLNDRKDFSKDPGIFSNDLGAFSNRDLNPNGLLSSHEVANAHGDEKSVCDEGTSRPGEQPVPGNMCHVGKKRPDVQDARQVPRVLGHEGFRDEAGNQDNFDREEPGSNPGAVKGIQVAAAIDSWCREDQQDR